MTESLVLLGSTGSIGKQTLDVARQKNIKIEAICANSNIALLEEQIREFKPLFCGVADEKAAKELKVNVADTNTKIVASAKAIEELAYNTKSPMLLNAMLGKCGIRPTVAAIKSKKNISMANKEPLVAAGDIILKEVKENGVKLLPVDSEHSAIFQCLDHNQNKKDFIKRLIITASGGPFYGKSEKELENITPAEAVNHPTWSMGKKISVDSATLMNKGLEVIEAVRLFGVPSEKIDVTVHKQSIVHSMVEFVDGSVLAQMGNPDMRHCIQFALTYPDRVEGMYKPLDFTKAFSLTFDAPDEKTFRLLPLARRAVSMGGHYPCIMNGANEMAVDLFLKGKIKFTDITLLVESAVNNIKDTEPVTLDSVEKYDRISREYINGLTKT